MDKYTKEVEAQQWQPGVTIEGVSFDPNEVTTTATKEKLQAAEAGSIGAINTAYGWKIVKAGDYVIKHANGELSVMSEENFKQNYSPIEAPVILKAADPMY